MRHEKIIRVTALILATATAASFAGISINVKASHLTYATDAAISDTGPGYWLVWSSDRTLGQVFDDGSIDGGDIAFYQGAFDNNPIPNYYGLWTDPSKGRVFLDGESGVPDFNSGYLFGIGFNCRPDDIAEGIVYKVTAPVNLSTFTDFELPLPVPPPTPDNFDFAESITFDISAGPFTVAAAAGDPPIIITSISVDGTNFTLNWYHDGMSNEMRYALQSTTNLIETEWMDVPPFTNMVENSVFTTITNVLDAQNNFYRLKQE